MDRSERVQYATVILRLTEVYRQDVNARMCFPSSARRNLWVVSASCTSWSKSSKEAWLGLVLVLSYFSLRCKYSASESLRMWAESSGTGIVGVPVGVGKG